MAEAAAALPRGDADGHGQVGPVDLLGLAVLSVVTSVWRLTSTSTWSTYVTKVDRENNYPFRYVVSQHTPKPEFF